MKHSALPFLFLFAVLGAAFGVRPACAQTPAGARIIGGHIDAGPGQPYDSAVALAQRFCVGAVHVFIPWDSIETTPGHYNGHYRQYLTSADQYFSAIGLPLEFNIALLNTVKRETPPDLATTPYDAPVFRTRFKRLLDTVLAAMPNSRFVVFNIGNEVDGVLGNDTAEYGRYRRFLVDVGAYARQRYAAMHPGQTLRIGTTIMAGGALDAFRGPLCQSLAQAVDVYSLTYYAIDGTFHVLDTVQAAADLAALAAAGVAANRPVYLVEVGYPSSPVDSATEASQAAFYRTLFRVWDAHAAAMPYVAPFQLTDWSQGLVDTLGTYYGIATPAFLEYLRTLGLCRIDGAPKPAYYTLQHEAQARGFCQALAVPAPPTLPTSSACPTAYPMPLRDGMLHIANVPDGPVTFTNVLGQVVCTAPLQSGTVDVGALPPGLYWGRAGEVAVHVVVE